MSGQSRQSLLDKGQHPWVPAPGSELCDPAPPQDPCLQPRFGGDTPVHAQGTARAQGSPLQTGASIPHDFLVSLLLFTGHPEP